MEYKTILRPCEARFVEKKSEFIGYLCPVESEEQALAFINEVRALHRKATHNCYAYILRENNTARHSDDGEPQGTAGIPMLEVLKREGVTNVVCVVTRYSGGVLLGTGGLLRAYTKSAKDALDAAGICVVRRWVKAEIACSYAMLERLKTECTAIGGVVADIEYSADVCLKLLLPEDKADAFSQRTADVTAGASELEITGEEFKPVRIR